MHTIETILSIGLGALALVLGYLVVSRWYRKKYTFTPDDEKYAHEVLSSIDPQNIFQVHDSFIKENFDNVLMVKKPVNETETKAASFFNIPNIRYWPYYSYTYPYQYSEGGAWPPNMYSRLYHWQPGYDTAGWSYWMRPGMSYARWPRNRWVQNNGTYYFINNGGSKARANDYL
jgi:hypothetical protein